MASPTPAPYSASDKEKAGAWDTLTRRWPIILTQAVDGLHQAASALALSSSSPDTDARVQESKQIIEQISKLKHDLGRDRQLEDIPQDAGSSVQLYNQYLEKLGRPTWFAAPWLFAECYLYRLLRTFFENSTHWKHYDPFSSQKLSAFRSSGAAIEQLAQTLEQLISQQQQQHGGAGSDANTAANTQDGLKVSIIAEPRTVQCPSKAQDLLTLFFRLRTYSSPSSLWRNQHSGETRPT